ncbi:unannotated protein [freshwater metagenome]|uniref:Unannotated protein n=1 Tax=freshwater metagenome TaxID=449393 RepID=A0A6J6USA3_9ZZZZ
MEVSVGHDVGRWVVLPSLEIVETRLQSSAILVVGLQRGHGGQHGLDPLAEDEQFPDDVFSARVA